MMRWAWLAAAVASCDFAGAAALWRSMHLIASPPPPPLPCPPPCSHVFNRSKDCGKCIKLRGTNGKGKWTIVKVVDECASCKGKHDVDLSIPALKSSTGYRWDRKVSGGPAAAGLPCRPARPRLPPPSIGSLTRLAPSLPCTGRRVEVCLVQQRPQADGRRRQDLPRHRPPHRGVEREPPSHPC